MLAPDDEVVAALDGRVGHLADAADAHRRRAARHQPGGPHLGVLGEAQVVAVQGVLELDFVDLQIAADGDEHRLPLVFISGHVEHGLERLGLRDVQELGQARDGLDAGGGDFLQGGFGFRLGVTPTPALPLRGREYRGDDRLGFFGVGDVVAARAGDDGVLAGVGGQQEFVGVLAADGAAVGLGHQHRQAAAPEDVAVRLRHVLIGGVQAGVVGVEGVGVLHVELAHPYQPGAGTGFVAELGLNLVQQLRQVAVALPRCS